VISVLNSSLLRSPLIYSKEVQLSLDQVSKEARISGLLLTDYFGCLRYPGLSKKWFSSIKLSSPPY
jgi:hypothetical protein